MSEELYYNLVETLAERLRVAILSESQLMITTTHTCIRAIEDTYTSLYGNFDAKHFHEAIEAVAQLGVNVYQAALVKNLRGLDYARA